MRIERILKASNLSGGEQRSGAAPRRVVVRLYALLPSLACSARARSYDAATLPPTTHHNIQDAEKVLEGLPPLIQFRESGTETSNQQNLLSATHNFVHLVATMFEHLPLQRCGVAPAVRVYKSD